MHDMLQQAASSAMVMGPTVLLGGMRLRRPADSDEAAPSFRDDCAPGFRDDLAPLRLGSCWL
jgi:hypothetical protein